MGHTLNLGGATLLTRLFELGILYSCICTLGSCLVLNKESLRSLSFSTTIFAISSCSNVAYFGIGFVRLVTPPVGTLQRRIAESSYGPCRRTLLLPTQGCRYLSKFYLLLSVPLRSRQGKCGFHHLYRHHLLFLRQPLLRRHPFWRHHQILPF